MDTCIPEYSIKQLGNVGHIRGCFYWPCLIIGVVSAIPDSWIWLTTEFKFLVLSSCINIYKSLNRDAPLRYGVSASQLILVWNTDLESDWTWFDPFDSDQMFSYPVYCYKSMWCCLTWQIKDILPLHLWCFAWLGNKSLQSITDLPRVGVLDQYKISVPWHWYCIKNVKMGSVHPYHLIQKGKDNCCHPPRKKKDSITALFDIDIISTICYGIIYYA